MAILLLTTLILMSSLTVFAANQGNGDAIQVRQRLQDKTCVDTSLENCSGVCTQDMLRIQEMLKIRNRLRIKDHLTVQDQLRLHEHIYLHDGSCLIS